MAEGATRLKSSGEGFCNNLYQLGNDSMNNNSTIDLSRVVHGIESIQSACSPGDIDDCSPDRGGCIPDDECAPDRDDCNPDKD